MSSLAEIVGAVLAGGALKQAADYALARRAMVNAEKKRESESDATLQEHVARYSKELFEHYRTELDSQAKKHSEELDEQAQRHAEELNASAEKVRAANARADAAELESERNRSRLREAERERDHERNLRITAEVARDEAIDAIRLLSDNLKVVTDEVNELKRNQKRTSGEMPAVKL